MDQIWAKKGFARCIMQHVNAGKVHLCTLPARDIDFLFFIPLEIDLEGIEIASKWYKMPPTSIFGVFLTHLCLYLVGATRSF